MAEENVDNVAPEVTDAAPAGKFYDSWDEDLKSSPSLEKFGSEQEVFKSYLELQKLNGYKGDIPSPDASDDEWALFNEKIGVRADPSEYNIAPPEGFDLGDEHIQKIQQIAKNYNLTDKQEGAFNDVLGYYAELEAQSLAAEEAQYNEAVEGLKSEWGDEYKERSADVRYFQNKLGLTEEQAEAINSNPDAVRAFYLAASKTGEKSQVGTQYGTTQAGLAAQIESLENDLVDQMSTDSRSPKIDQIQEKLYHLRSKQR